MKKNLSVAEVGAGMGGLAVAATLQRVGIEVQVYEQATRFGRIGAGIQMMPNSSWLYGYDVWNANLDQPAAHLQIQAA